MVHNYRNQHAHTYTHTHTPTHVHTHEWNAVLAYTYLAKRKTQCTCHRHVWVIYSETHNAKIEEKVHFRISFMHVWSPLQWWQLWSSISSSAGCSTSAGWEQPCSQQWCTTQLSPVVQRSLRSNINSSLLQLIVFSFCYRELEKMPKQHVEPITAFLWYTKWRHYTSTVTTIPSSKLSPSMLHSHCREIIIVTIAETALVSAQCFSALIDLIRQHNVH